jgi:hypothetical protein
MALELNLKVSSDIEAARERRRAIVAAQIEERQDVDVSTIPITGDLYNWLHITSRGGGVGGTIYGDLYNDVNGRWRDGQNIRTSAIVKIVDNVAVTLNSAYRLHNPIDTEIPASKVVE